MLIIVEVAEISYFFVFLSVSAGVLLALPASNIGFNDQLAETDLHRTLFRVNLDLICRLLSPPPFFPTLLPFALWFSQGRRQERTRSFNQG